MKHLWLGLGAGLMALALSACGQGGSQEEAVDPLGQQLDSRCRACEGKVSELTLRFLGTETSRVRVEQRREGRIFEAWVHPGEHFDIQGVDRKNTLGTEISIFVDGDLDASVHTSCSQPIGPGLVAGSFEVVEGTSRRGGLLCPMPGDDRGDDDHGGDRGDDEEDCNDGDRDRDRDHWGKNNRNRGCRSGWGDRDRDRDDDDDRGDCDEEPEPCSDADSDGVCDEEDNCTTDANADQADSDGDGIGDVCDETPEPCSDVDGDSICDEEDNCAADANADQADSDGDGVGDACDACAGGDDGADADGDGVCDALDSCADGDDAADADGDGVADACDTCAGGDDSADADGDGVCDAQDNCATDANADQADSDGDGIGDVCEPPTGVIDVQMRVNTTLACVDEQTYHEVVLIQQGTQVLPDVSVVVHLPELGSFIEVIGSVLGNYDTQAHTVTWEVGDLPPWEYRNMGLAMRVLPLGDAEPAMRVSAEVFSGAQSLAISNEVYTELIEVH